MRKRKKITWKDHYQKEFVETIEKLSYGRSLWEVWDDMITIFASALSLPLIRDRETYDERKASFDVAYGHIKDHDILGRSMDILVSAFEEDPDRDFLGEIFSGLGFSSHWRGQFFTPYCVSKCMARIMIDPEKIRDQLDERGYISTLDPCVGSGSLLIAAANMLKENNVDYQRDVLFVGQDISPIVAKMAFIQLSLFGCPGYIVIGDSITNPVSGNSLFPVSEEQGDIWYTPMFFRTIWNGRKQVVMIRRTMETMDAMRATDDSG